MQTLVVTPAGQDAAGVLVDDQNLAVGDDVVLVAGEQLLGLHRVVEELHEGGVGRLVQVVDAQLVLDHVDRRLQHPDRALLDVDLVVVVRAHLPGERGELGVPLRALLGRAGDDQRRAGLVDEDRVHLVHDGEVVAALDAVLRAPGHVVPQVVEAELVVGAVGDVARVRELALGRGHRRQDEAGRHPEEVVDATHLLALELREIVVHRDDVDAVAFERVQVPGERRHHRLALTGLHLGDVAEVKSRATHDLDVEVTLVEHAPGRLPDGGERFSQEIVERLALVQPATELRRLGLQFFVAEGLDVVLEGGDAPGDDLQLADGLAFAGSEDLVEDAGHGYLRVVVGHGSPARSAVPRGSSTPSGRLDHGR